MRNALLLSLLVLPHPAWHGGHDPAPEEFPSPDHEVVAVVHRAGSPAGGDCKDSLVIEDRRVGRVLFGTGFQVPDEEGQCVVKAEWSEDSLFFVCSTVFAAGRRAGHFPIYIYDRRSNAFLPVEGLLRIRPTDPEFQIEPPDILLVRGIDQAEAGGDTLYRAAHLGVIIDRSQ